MALSLPTFALGQSLLTDGGFDDTASQNVNVSAGVQSTAITGWTLKKGKIVFAPTAGSAAPEPYYSNVRGTLAALPDAQSAGDSTSGWFFHLSDANADTLDAQNDTVFGSLINGVLDVLDAIAAVPTYQPTGFSDDFANLPLRKYKPAKKGEAALLQLKITGNTKPKLVTATLKGSQLFLSYARKQTGPATITIQAQGAAKATVTTTIIVSVGPQG